VASPLGCAMRVYGDLSGGAPPNRYRRRGDLPPANVHAVLCYTPATMARFKFTQADYDAFEREMADFRAKSQTEIGQIIQCHLIVEYYVNRCLAACYRTMRGDDAPRLTFQQKVDLLPKW